MKRLLLIAALLLLALPARAQIAFAQSTDVASANPSATSITTGAFASNVGAARLMVAYVAWVNDATVSSFTSTDGSSWQACHAAVSLGATDLHAQPFYAWNTTGGSSVTVTANFSTSVPFRKIQANEYSGIEKDSDPLDANAGNSNAASANPTSGTDTTTVADTVLVGGVSVGSGDGEPAAGANFTLRSTQNFFAMEDRIVSSTGTYEAPWTYASSNWVAHMCAFKIDASAVGVGVSRRAFGFKK